MVASLYQAMLYPVYAALGVAVVFYVLLPVVFAFRGGSAWHRFRDRFCRLVRGPHLTHTSLAAEGAEGVFTLSGVVEALEGTDLLWVRGKGVSARIDFARSPLYVLAAESEEAGLGGTASAGSLTRLPWRQVRTFSEGSRIFVGGLARREGGIVTFHEAPSQVLIAVSYGGSETDLFRRVIEGARSRNEFLNPLTFAWWAAGIVVLSALLVYWARHSPIPTVRFLSALVAFSPLVALLPPGGLLLYVGGRWWRRCLARRMARDLSCLEGGDRAKEPEGAKPAVLPYGAILRRLLRDPLDRLVAFEAGMAFVAVAGAVVVNYVLAFLLFRALQ